MSLPASEPESSSGESWGPRIFSVLLLVLLAVAGVLELIPAHYYVIAPGDAVPVEPMIAVKGHPMPKGAGQLYMTDVSVQEINHKLEELYWRIRPHVEIDPAKEVAGNLSAQQYLQLNDQLMSDSIRKAEVAALSVTTGYKLRFKKTGPEVVFTVPNSPAASRLQVGDVIEAVDGHRTRRADEVSPLIKRHVPGSVVHLLILRHGRHLRIDLRPIRSRNGVPDKRGKTPLIGVYVQDQIDLPVNIQIRPGNIGGPSAGLMFSLGLVERLGSRDITKGCKVAGTGTIDFDGTVGAIGGASQKVLAAQNAGAQYFFVPATPDNAGPARAAASHITVVPVKSLQQALRYLRTIKPCH